MATPSWIFKTWFLSNDFWAIDFPPLYQIWRNNVERRRNYGPKSTSRMAAVRHLVFSKIRFLSTGTHGLPFFYHCTKFGAKMLIDAEIMAQNRNSRWRPSAILDFRKTDFWQIGCLGPGVSIFHLCTKFGAKILIGAQIIAKNLNSRWRPSAILEFLYHRIGPPT